MARDGMFQDETTLTVHAGRGGDGCCSFRREKYVSMGGPDGGDGGKGGSVLLRAVVHENSLYRISRNRIVQAGNGQPGGGNNRSGAQGKSVEICVPVGTQVFDLQHGNLLADLKVPDETLLVAQGGRGGRGNSRFSSATNQAPRRFDLGTDGESRELRLELKLVADVGLVGLPNAGKSTLLARVTAARPKIANYPFTTLNPSLGIWDSQSNSGSQLVLADIPGLIEGASDGKGLGHQFLRHVERTRVLLHLVDCSAEAEDPLGDWRAIRAELEAYSSALAERPTILAATKVEDEDSEARAEALFEESGRQGLILSSVTGRGLAELRAQLLGEVSELKERP